MKFNFAQFATSITGVSSITALSLLVLKKYDLAAILFMALTLGSTGVLWERYSRKNGSALDIKVLAKKKFPEKEELEFTLQHAPYPVLAVVSYFLAKKSNQ